MTTGTHLLGGADWVKSSYSGEGSNCVEVADLTGTTRDGVAVRDSKDPAGPALLLRAEAFAASVADVPAGHYDV